MNQSEFLAIMYNAGNRAYKMRLVLPIIVVRNCAHIVGGSS